MLRRGIKGCRIFDKPNNRILAEGWPGESDIKGDQISEVGAFSLNWLSRSLAKTGLCGLGKEVQNQSLMEKKVEKFGQRESLYH